MGQDERLDLEEKPGKLPVAQFLDMIRDAFQRHKRVVIVAPAGLGSRPSSPCC
jgi:HrpA-like RNA helicase